jgi:hypothetical protein
MRLADLLMTGDLDTVKLMHSLHNSRTVQSLALDGIRREKVPVSTPAKVADLQIQGSDRWGFCKSPKGSLDTSETLNR